MGLGSKIREFDAKTADRLQKISDAAAQVEGNVGEAIEKRMPKFINSFFKTIFNGRDDGIAAVG